MSFHKLAVCYYIATLDNAHIHKMQDVNLSQGVFFFCYRKGKRGLKKVWACEKKVLKAYWESKMADFENTVNE